MLDRFISPDSIVSNPNNPGLFIRFAYVLNNPLTFTDPTSNCIFGLPCPKRARQALDVTHIVLDVAGMVPVIGEAADLVNVVLYVGEGDFVNAAISAASMVPVAGSVASGGRLVVKAADGLRTAIKSADTVTAGLKNGSRAVGAAPSGGVHKLVDDAGGVQYVGRTSNFIGRQADHARDPVKGSFDFKAIYETDNLVQQRGLEQFAYDNFNPVLNKIRPVAKSNPRLGEYEATALDFMENGL